MASERLPIFPLGTVLFPEAMLPLHIFEERYRRMLRDTQEQDPAFAIVLLERGSETSPHGIPAEIGTACSVAGISARPDGRSDIVVTGAFRVRITDVDWTLGYGRATVTRLDDIVEEGPSVERVYHTIRRRFAQYLGELQRLVRQTLPSLELDDDAVRGAWVVAETLTLHTWERQRLLEFPSVDTRLNETLRLLRREIALLRHTGAVGSTVEFPGRDILVN